MIDKSRQSKAFGSLGKKRQKAVKLLFEDDLSDEQIAKSVYRSRATLSKWKKEDTFKQAQEEYRKIHLDNSVPPMLKNLQDLALNAKSEMVRMQATQSILNMFGFNSVDNPKLTEAQIRKANAEADIKEAQAKQFKEQSGNNITVEMIKSDRRKDDDTKDEDNN